MAYLQRNWTYLRLLRTRGIHDENACVGAIDSPYRKMTYRMKRQGRLWTKSGAGAMIRIIDSLRNNALNDWLNQYYGLPDKLQENEYHWKKMKRAVLKKPVFSSRVGVFNGWIIHRSTSDSSLGRLSSALNQLVTTPSYL